MSNTHVCVCVCLCVLPCSSLLCTWRAKQSQPRWAELWGSSAVCVTVETKSPEEDDSHLKMFWNPHFRKQAPTWNQTFCPKIFLSGQSGLKYRAMMTPALTVDIQAISMKAPTDTNRYCVSETRCFLEKFSILVNAATRMSQCDY